MKYLFLLTQYIVYRWKAKSAHGIHSPFVYDFIHTVLNDQRHFYAFDEINEVRNKFYNDLRLIEVEDFGAGSLHGSYKQRRVCDIAKQAGRNEKFGKLLFRIVNKYQCKNMLELGTSLGIGTSYMAAVSKQSKIISIEGSKHIAAIAQDNFLSLSLLQVKLKIGNFNELLSPILEQNEPFDLILIDGNHRREATLTYFNQIIPFLNENTILIFDDIHWSKGMNQAWNTIQADDKVRLSIDLFFFGLVFFRKEFKGKQHFILKY